MLEEFINIVAERERERESERVRERTVIFMDNKEQCEEKDTKWLNLNFDMAYIYLYVYIYRMYNIPNRPMQFENLYVILYVSKTILLFTYTRRP